MIDRVHVIVAPTALGEGGVKLFDGIDVPVSELIPVRVDGSGRTHGWRRMFTGIVEAVGTLAEVKGTGGGYRVSIHTPLASELKIGDSLAVNGVCLTVILIDGEHVLADVGPETARVTTFGALQRGQEVNLERPMRGGRPVDGHFVLGHVDGVGVIEETARKASPGG